jgi:hypothetical protein
LSSFGDFAGGQVEINEFLRGEAWVSIYFPMQNDGTTALRDQISVPFKQVAWYLQIFPEFFLVSE